MGGGCTALHVIRNTFGMGVALSKIGLFVPLVPSIYLGILSFSLHCPFYGNVLCVVPLDYVFNVNYTYSVWVLLCYMSITKYSPFFLQMPLSLHSFKLLHVHDYNLTLIPALASLAHGIHQDFHFTPQTVIQWAAYGMFNVS